MSDSSQAAPEGARSFGFNAEVRQLLDLVIHSLYSDREIFLRELISNASDALDRARVLALSNSELRAADGDPGLRIVLDKEANTLTLSDNGVGLTEAQAIEHLGTIARSGTKAFAQMLKEKGQEAQHGLIGQFGVGFYSALMVADRVVVHSLSAEPEARAVIWACDGSTDFTVSEGSRTSRGTDVTLYLREDAVEYLDEDRVREVVQKHSRYIGYPILMGEEQLNEPQVLWTRSPSEVTEDEYKGFYKQLSGDWSDPAFWMHVQADAPIQYRAILYFPEHAPMDLNYTNGRRVLKLYARKVLILDEARDLLPDWLRFVRGVVDSEDLQLNVSREMVQKTPLLTQVKKQLTGRILKRITGFAKDQPEDYKRFWGEFGAVLKEGVHGDADNRDKLLKLARFNSTRHDDNKGLVSLDEYIAAMPEGQDAIWYLTGPDRDTCARSPLLESLRKKGWEVLLLTDPVDEWVVQSVQNYESKPLRSVSRGDLKVDEERPELDEGLNTWLKELFKGEVREVRSSKRLTDSPSVLVDDDYGLGANMERILRGVQKDVPSSMRVLELNAGHPMVQAIGRLREQGRGDDAEPLARLLLDQARLVEGQVTDPAALVQRLSALSKLAAQALGVDAG